MACSFGASGPESSAKCQYVAASEATRCSGWTAETAASSLATRNGDSADRPRSERRFIAEAANVKTDYSAPCAHARTRMAPHTMVRPLAGLALLTLALSAVAQSAPAPRRILVVPIRYAGPPQGASEDAVEAHRATLPKVTRDAVLPVMRQVADWYARETYGVVTLDVVVQPALTVDKLAPGCAPRQIAQDEIGRASCRERA